MKALEWLYELNALVSPFMRPDETMPETALRLLREAQAASQPLTGETNRFRDWLTHAHPDIALLDSEWAMVNAIYSNGRGTGKTFVVRLLAEYDATQTGADAQPIWFVNDPE